MGVQKSEVQMKQFSRNCRTISARLLIFNRRRPIEVAGLTVTSYRNRSNGSNIDEPLIGHLQERELQVFNSLDLMTTEGKGSHIVPVLIPPECQEGLDWIAAEEVQKQVHLEEAPYLFATSSKFNPVFSPADALKDAARAADLKYPERIGGTAMRHYMATLAQTLSLTEFQFQHVLKHMGHTRKVHLENYRLSAPSVERLELGKILLMQDRNVQNMFLGRELSEVTFEEILSAEPAEIQSESALPMATEDSPGQVDNDSNSASGGASEGEEDAGAGMNETRYMKRKYTSGDDNDAGNGNSKRSRGNKKRSCRHVKKRQGNVKRTHKRWQAVEDEINTIFKKNFEDLVTPTRSEILKKLAQNDASEELRSQEKL